MTLVAAGWRLPATVSAEAATPATVAPQPAVTAAMTATPALVATVATAERAVTLFPAMLPAAPGGEAGCHRDLRRSGARCRLHRNDQQHRYRR